MKKLIVIIFALALTTTGCATWSTSNVKTVNNSQTIAASSTKQILPQDVLLLETDIGDRKYKVLRDIEVTVRKTTILNRDPTQEMVNEELRKKAATLGADAVILVRFGTVGVSFWSWGALSGKGRAIVFSD